MLVLIIVIMMWKVLPVFRRVLSSMGVGATGLAMGGVEVKGRAQPMVAMQLVAPDAAAAAIQSLLT